MMTVREAFALGFAHEAAGRPAEARAIYDQILAAIPDHPGALLKIAQAEQKDGRLERARELLERAIDSAARENLPQVDIWIALGSVHKARTDFLAAKQAFERARELGCETPVVHQMLAWLALERGDAVDARALCRSGLIAHPGDAVLLHLFCNALKECGELAQARIALNEAANAPGSDPRILVSLGAVCIDLGLAGEAREHLTRAIDRGADAATTFDSLGLACLQMGDMDEAAGAFERAVALDPTLTPALSNLLNTLRHACRWDEADAVEGKWLAGLDQPDRDPRWNPFLALALQTTPAQQLATARSWSRHMLPPVQAPGLLRARGTRLRIGYLSSDFREHPVSSLIAGHFEHHDRRRFEVFGYSHGPDDGSAIRQRLQAGFEHWVEARAMSNARIAQRIRDDGIDVLIDLNGHTIGDRLAVLAHRPAPVQLHYLGFPGTIGFDGIDGIIADAVVVPSGDERYFHERVLRLPRCYQVTDDKRALPPRQSRAALGLADNALVLVCFNQAYKLTRTFFGVWIDVLREVPDALLWLYIPAPLARTHLRTEAVRAGVDPDRIRFATKVSPDEHIARLRCADLALDVLPYGSHTTGSDALAAGVPMLSCRGTTFAGRVGETLLNAVGLSELVTESLDAYRAKLLMLARDRERLRFYKDYLQRERRRLPLFDTDGFTRDFEALICAAYDDTAAGLRSD